MVRVKAATAANASRSEETCDIADTIGLQGLVETCYCWPDISSSRHSRWTHARSRPQVVASIIGD